MKRPGWCGTNYRLDTSSLPTETFSTFYLPHLVYQLAGFENPFVDTVLEEMKKGADLFSGRKSQHEF